MNATPTQTERQELTEWIENNDHYEGLGSVEDESLAKLRKTKTTIEALDAVLKQAAAEIKKIANKHRSFGIGDTATDEAIAGYFYCLQHAAC